MEYENENDDDFEEFEGDILGSFLIDEPPDIDLLIFPKLEFNLEDELERYYKQLKKCKNKEQIKLVLRQFFVFVQGITSIQNDLRDLQDRAKELEFNIALMKETL